MRRTAVVVLGFAALVATSCAESQPTAPPPTAASPAAAPAAVSVVGPPQVAWAGMTKDQRKEYMKMVVLPKMKETFVAFNAEHFTTMNCLTCHGDGANDGSFTMPNPKLPKLPTTPDGFKKLMTDKPDMTQFMATKVKPQMAQLLGEPEFTPESKTGFGCYGCHTKE